MINSIHLINFQSHKNSKIVFSRGVNALVGLSDSGKTAILRALTWVLTNKPSGEEFRSNWGGDTSVVLELADGTLVERGRTNNDNYYSLTPLDGETQSYRAFGQGLPPDIEAKINFNDINTAFQMDAPFLLSASPGDVAQLLNKVASLEVIDKSISNIRKTKLDIDRQYRSAQEAVIALEDKMKEFDYLEQMEIDIASLEQLSRAQAYIQTRCSGLSRIAVQAGQLSDKIAKLEGLVAAESALQAATKLLAKQASMSDRRKGLQALINTISDKVVLIRKASKLCAAEKDVLDVLPKITVLKNIETSIKATGGIIASIRTKQRAFDKLFVDIKRMEEEFRDNMPDTCPLCGGMQ